ncbi:Uncharacterized protein dnl_41100 [Desulfonema limicola]|uniref:Uncharacterized protein n=1 Tax=Desulfonema limicola TaxID=45656 RepID=A0A975GHQ1_9BACT|nr:hypothetical protein [Desulfonema limicola]QTA81761.1 Uncharacterized protein dnl_41100 [Desulfonema limicola]
MKIIIQKPDLDTCLTGFILGVKFTDQVVVSKGEALPADISNPCVLCIEAGGSGLVHLNNFDHHNTDIYLPPACKQAFDYKKLDDPMLAELTRYVCLVDEAVKIEPPIDFPSLSNLFSGMLFTVSDPLEQFFSGMEMFNRVLIEKINPFGTVPDIDEWKGFRQAKEEHIKKLNNMSNKGVFYVSNTGLRIGFIETDLIMGGRGFLYANNCDAVILHNPAFGLPPMSKYTIISKDLSLGAVKQAFDKIEPGWGGHDTILGSPIIGTILDNDQVIKVVLDSFSYG